MNGVDRKVGPIFFNFFNIILKNIVNKFLTLQIYWNKEN